MPVADLLNPQVAEFDAVINGKRLPPGMRDLISSIVVDDSVALPSMFTLELSSTVEMDDANELIDNALFDAGNVVEIKLGYGDQTETLLVGEITAVEPEFVFDRLPSLIVRGYDRRHRLQRGRKTRTFVQQKDSDIASKIAREAGLSADAVDSSVTHDYVIQANQTDLDFLQERASLIRYEVVVYDKQLFFRPVRNDKSPVLTLTMDDHLLEFTPRLSTAGQVSEVSVRGWNPKEKKEIVSLAQAGAVVTMDGKQSGPKMSTQAFGSTTDVVSEHPLMTQAESDQMAAALLNRKALSLIEGEGLCLGRTDLRAGEVIRIDGVGQKFGGKYYVTNATHRYSAGDGYHTRFQVRRNTS